MKTFELSTGLSVIARRTEDGVYTYTRPETVEKYPDLYIPVDFLLVLNTNKGSTGDRRDEEMFGSKKEKDLTKEGMAFGESYFRIPVENGEIQYPS